MAMSSLRKVNILRFLILFITLCSVQTCHSASTDIELDAKAQQLHRIDSLNLLLYTFLLTLTVLTIWLFKHRRLRFLHETGLAVIYGLIIGALIRYTGSSNSETHLSVFSQNNTKYNLTVPPDTLWYRFPSRHTNNTSVNGKTYSYTFRGEIVDVENNEIDLKATFDPEIFFNIILPPIIFHAGYSLKRRYFFRNLGAILTYAIIGTTISSFVVSLLMYGLIQLMPHLKTSFTFLDTLYFGALISSTDPLTILAIFNDLHVDVNLYALVFGESVLNDAVSIVLSGSIQNYGKKYQSNESQFEPVASFMQTKLLNCPKIYLTKYTRVRDFPLLESALFVLMSYSTFLIAEVSDLTGAAKNLRPYSFNGTQMGYRLVRAIAKGKIIISGLRGAMSFALAIRNTLSEARQAMLTTTSLIVIVTVIVQGGATMQLLTWFNIPVGVEEEVEVFPYSGVRNVYNSTGTPTEDAGEASSHTNEKQVSEKALLARIWGDFDTKYMKPFLTDSRPTLLETLPVCCNPIARLLTTTTQLTQDVRSRSRHDSDSDICLEESAVRRNSRSSIPKLGSSISGDLGLRSGIMDTIIKLQDNLNGNNV
ncbi:hypothetical protein RUM43_012447 [Polyplax serrata]|uniref:Cation/H+ exchanger transmembrane domain-containing protein n=1 Tax=Polyplax serrata TaxID=468196 RepID=A0AAN8RZE6_POLSC